MGLSTIEEMCLVYTVYYPRMPPGNEQCLWGDFTGTAKAPAGRVFICNNSQTVQAPLPTVFTPYIPPVCSYMPPGGSAVASYDATPVAEGEFAFSTELVPDVLTVYWSLDTQTQEMHMAAEVNETQGWLGLGISTNGGMVGADMAMGWVVGQEVYFTDRYATATAKPNQDALQDYYDVSAGVYQRPEASSMLTAGQKALIGVLSALLLIAVVAGCYRYRKHRPTGETQQLVPEGVALGSDTETPSDHAFST